ncbi:DoxX family protein [Mycobacterium sp. 1274761.0]|uniref:DoxX family protein n=1 Tax=Mycobacterium sp. 1274761.0 TaxID=1834077 RepID=UPI000801A6A6|nr:DoxX family protein [Mycobacterium sp. 1274761.0]OBK72095.1 DoxX family protein [Mycobacterium sp. 1274761.0]
MTNLDARLAGYHSPVLSAFRIIFGLLYTIHGSQKLFGWPVPAPAPIETGSFPYWWAGLIEFVLGVLITLGLFTRIAAFIASGEMAFAYFYQHWPPLKGGPTASFWPIENGGELAILYCFGFLLLATTGAGLLSVDARRRRRVATTGTVAGTAAAPPRRPGLLSRFRR